MPPPLMLVDGPRLLETAFHAARAKNEAPSETTVLDLYNKFFATLPVANQGRPFERFSLIDPNIRTFVASTTNTAS